MSGLPDVAQERKEPMEQGTWECVGYGDFDGSCGRVVREVGLYADEFGVIPLCPRCAKVANDDGMLVAIAD